MSISVPLMTNTTYEANGTTYTIEWRVAPDVGRNSEVALYASADDPYLNDTGMRRVTLWPMRYDWLPFGTQFERVIATMTTFTNNIAALHRFIIASKKTPFNIEGAAPHSVRINFDTRWPIAPPYVSIAVTDWLNLCHPDTAAILLTDYNAAETIARVERWFVCPELEANNLIFYDRKRMNDILHSNSPLLSALPDQPRTHIDPFEDDDARWVSKIWSQDDLGEDEYLIYTSDSLRDLMYIVRNEMFELYTKLCPDELPTYS